MKAIFDGKVASTTGLSYRGKGLPSLRRAAEEGRIKNLVVLSNDVYARVTDGVFDELSTAFGGTIISWELGEVLP